MMKTFSIFFTFMIVAAWLNISAQENTQSNGPIPNMKSVIKHTIVNQIDNPLATIAYGHESQSGATLSMPIPAGTPFTTLGNWTAPNFGASMVKGGNGVYYLIDIAPGLYEFNTGTGAVTSLGAITGTSGDQPNGITYNPVNSMYYLISGTNFYSLDVNTRVATLIGSMGVAGSLFIDLCFNAAGVCYAYDLVTDAAYTINSSTGVATLLGPLGYDANFGQGMSYDMETSTIYLSAFNNGAFQGELRTMDPGTGATTLITGWGLQQVAPFALDTQYGPPCPVGAPSNPSPANGAVDVPITGNTATWTNGSATTQIELWFGPAGNLTMVYSGAPITSFALPTLNYFTDYAWYVKCGNGTCFTFGPTWTFRTVQDPNLATLFCDDFSSGAGNWTITNDGGVCIWEIRDVSEYTLPSTAVGNCLAVDTDDCNGTSGNGLSTARRNGINASLYQTVWLEFDNDWQAIDANDFAIVDVSVDGGTTWQNVLTFNATDVRNTHEVWDLTSLVALSTFDIRFKSIQPGWDWWWAVDNICIYATDMVPVELTSFTATADYGVVELRWFTATETNNQGFEVQRSNGSEFETIAFVDGHGTTTEVQAYVYSDRNVGVGTYSYRLKQVDFDGTSGYSNTIEVDVPAPAEFALDQNYPNPFNPSTQINFRLAVDSKVTLKVFDVLGQEIATLVNSNLVAGGHSVNFDASSLNSGVYLYRIEATGINGSNFVDVKKMILTK